MLKEANPPMPTRAEGVTTGRFPRHPWRTLEVGESFIFPNPNIRYASAAACMAAKRSGRKFTCKTTPEGVRIWRTA